MTHSFFKIFLVILYSLGISIIGNAQCLDVSWDASPGDCGQMNALVVISVSNGVPPYTFTFPDGNSVEQNDPLYEWYTSAGGYSIVVTDSNGCSGTFYAQADEVGNTIEILNLVEEYVCHGGSLTMPSNVSGGTPPYTHSWQGPNGFNSNIENPVVSDEGFYRHYVTDAAGCTRFKDIYVQEIGPVPIITPSSNCNGACDGAISVYDPTGQYTYMWSNGETTTNEGISGLCEGLYGLTVSGGISCNNVFSILIECEGDLELILAEAHPMCEGMCDGSITASVTGGVPPYQYNWSNGQIGDFVSDLCAGDYSVTIVDALGNIGFNSVPVVLEYNSELLYDVTTTAISCTGGGTIEIEMVTGSGDYIYSLNGVVVPSNIMTNVLTTNNVIHVEDSGIGCITTFDVFLDPPFDLVVTGTMAGCDVSDGTATATVNNSAATYNYLWSNGESTSTITGLAPGGYSVTVTDASNGCETHDNIIITEDPICYVLISGYVIDDSDDLDCMTTSVVDSVPLQMISLNNGEQYTFTDQNGYFSFQTDPGAHILVYESQTLLYDPLCADPISLTAANFGDEVSDNFYVQKNDVIDLRMNIVKSTMRPGFNHNVFVNIYNAATAVSNGEVVFTYDFNQTFVSANPQPTSIDETNRIITWNFDNMDQVSSAEYAMTFYLEPTVPLGTEITIGGIVNPTIDDIYPDNNSISCVGIVTGSYDPNDKTVSHDGSVSPWDSNIITPGTADELRYLVRFQNTGTDTAFTVVIEDELDVLLDVRDIIPGPASHPYNLDVRDGNTLIFTFNNILLPDSTTNEAASHGHVFFDVKIDPDIPLGDDILNDAAIFFDYNLPIITNEVVTIFDYWLSTEEVNSDQNIQLTPNPTNNITTVTLDLDQSANVSIELIDITGRLVQIIQQNEQMLAGKQEVPIDMSELVEGAYLVKLTIDKEVITKKLIKI